MEDKKAPIKERDVPVTNQELIGAYLANGMPNQLINVAARMEEYSWAQIAYLASQAFALKSRKEASEVGRLNGLVQLSESPEQGVARAADLAKMEAERVKSAAKAKDFEIFARRLNGEEVVSRSPDGSEIRLGPPSPQEMQSMFGRSVFQAGRGKPNR